jgi:N6-adenosine-specific RNA methylase IME4
VNRSLQITRPCRRALLAGRYSELAHLRGWRHTRFTYKRNFACIKDRIGTGYWARNRHELLLIGVKGNVPAPAPGKQYDSVIEAPIGAHSAKPFKVHEMIEDMLPTLPRIETFAREHFEGWDVWGNEVAAG